MVGSALLTQTRRQNCIKGLRTEELEEKEFKTPAMEDYRSAGVGTDDGRKREQSLKGSWDPTRLFECNQVGSEEVLKVAG